MPIMTGKPTCIRIGDDFGFTTIEEDSSGDQETFILWIAGVTTPFEVSVRERVMHSNWVAMLRDSLSGEALIRVTHEDGSAEVLNLELRS